MTTIGTSATLHFQGQQGLSLVADRHGNPQAPHVLLLHGGGQTRHSWDGAARRIAAAGWCALTLDARGHGESAWSATGDYSPDAFIGDLRAIVATLPGPPPALVGASMGGLTALSAVGESETPIASALVLVDISPRPEMKGVDRVIAFMRSAPDGFASLEEARAAIAAYNPHRPPPADDSGLQRNLRRGADGRWRWHWDPRFLNYAAKVSTGEALVHTERAETAARRVRIPTLLVRGLQSDVISAQSAQHLRQLIPQSELIEVSGAGHMVAGDRNDIFSSGVIEFLQRHYPCAGEGAPT